MSRSELGFRATIAAVAAVVACLVSCSVDLNVREGVLLPCNKLGQCPPPLVCQTELGFCVNPALGGPAQAPAVTLLAVEPGPGLRYVAHVHVPFVATDPNAAPVGDDTVDLAFEFTTDKSSVSSQATLCGRTVKRLARRR